MALILRGNTYHMNIPNPQGGKPIRESCFTGDKRLAQKAHDLRQAQVWEGRFIAKAEGCNLTLQQGFDRVMKEVWAGRKSEATNQYNFDRLLKYLPGDTLLTSLTRSSLRSTILKMQEDYPDATINRSLSVVSKILNQAKKEWEILPNPPAVPRLDEAKKNKHKEEGGVRLRWLQEGEQEAIQAFFKDKGDLDMSDLIEVLLGTGCRLSEVLNLESRDVDLKKGQLHLRDTKANTEAWQPMNDSALKVLARRFKIGIPPFQGLTRYAAIHRFQIMKKHLKLVDDKELCLHTMRHTVASRLVLAGQDLKRVQAFMRHKDINTTLRYAKLNQEENRKTAAVLN